MAQITSGKILRETRERKGYDLMTVARRLRIRPDILRAIESNDFSAMPPRGYARNMVNAYARLLGLNPTEIVNMYLDEAYAVQVQKARSKAPSSGFNMERDSWRGRSSRREEADGYTRRKTRETRDDRGRDPYGEAEFDAQRPARTSRRLYDDRTQFSRDDYGVTRNRVERQGRSDRDFMSHHSGYDASPDHNRKYVDFGSARYGSARGRGQGSGRGQRPGSDSPRRGRGQIHVGQTGMSYSAPGIGSFLRQRLPLVIGTAIALIVIFAIAFLIFGRGGSAPSDDVSQLPVSGINDTTGTADASGDEEISVELAPTSSRIVVSVDKGDEVYIETYEDGSDTATPLYLTGPAEETYETTSTWTITTYTPELVKVTVDGEAVTLKPSDDYNNMYAYTVDFKKILDEWNKAHPTSKSSQRQTAVAQAANAASAANAKSSSSSDKSVDSASTDSSSDTGASSGGRTSSSSN